MSVHQAHVDDAHYWRKRAVAAEAERDRLRARLEADRDTYRSAWNRAEADAVALRSKVERYEEALRDVEHWARNADLTPAQFWAVDRLTHEVLHHAAALSNPTATTEAES